MTFTFNDDQIPGNLDRLHKREQEVRDSALSLVRENPQLLLHLDVIESSMSLLKLIVGHPNNDENFRVVKLLAIRMFNAFSSSLSLMLSGYHQNSAMVMRDKLETLFLLDYFSTYREKIEDWRFADGKKKKKMFSPVAIRIALDARDGNKNGKRAEKYKMFSELAAHASMNSQHMLKPEKGGDILMGPFMELTTLRAGLYELGILAAQTGEIIDLFFTEDWQTNDDRVQFRVQKYSWMKTFYK